ncbi:TMEM165/GDT1 family protein [Alkalimarinus sediminis]|uniref:GDT1 family protein n=1 Tax=Alkalimarinus sediminis TaxID=1632866 RepID=A0A9E8HL88_9ALTE|nr:TMEM165/GDT1 family protein [Alkalimarinus sediminis]UZW74763.1 TMEM165/GDT1 family protein [Alkalimarinus sediminis]
MFASLASTFLLIFLAEFGDKSQLVCMLLASRHRGLPVFLGALTAFAILNILAVTIGAAAAQLISEFWLSVFVIALFSFFGIKSLLETEDDDGAIDEKPGHTVFITTFLMIFVAELGDKTQLTIAALAAAHQPISVYIGATLALAATTLIGIIGGRWVTQHISTTTLHRVSGGLFLAFAVWTTYTLF